MLGMILNDFLLMNIFLSASINNPMRSSLKKPKNKETASMISNASGKKSVRIALGEEQTAVWTFWTLGKHSKLKHSIIS